MKRRSFLLNDADLIGLDYLWRVNVLKFYEFIYNMDKIIKMYDEM